MRIVYFDIDSLRPDHLGCYGYRRNTSPNIDKIASEGIRFSNMYCASSPCVPARASFISGRFGINHGALTHWGPGCNFYYPEGDFHSKEMPFFTRYLREADHRTITFSSFGDRHHAWWFFAGWDEVHTHTLKGGNEDAHEVNKVVLPWIKEHGKDENYFLHIQYWDPHSAYTYPKEYAEQFSDDLIPEYPDEETIQKHRKDAHPRSAKFLHWTQDYNTLPQDTMPYEIENRKDFKKLIDGYDGGISYMDKHLGQIVDAYRELGIEDEICFIITADHAESFGEQGSYLEHGMATKAVHHIPLIVRAPGMASGKVNQHFIYNVDIMATVADMLELPVPTGWDGTSFLPVLKDEEVEGRDYLVLEHGLYACQRAVMDRKWYFLYTYHPGFYDIEQVILYDLENDPHQTINVAQEYPEVVEKMYFRLSKWVEGNISKNGVGKDPMREILASGGPFRYLEPQDWILRLENAGWHKEAEEYRRKYMKPPVEY
ncbi:sulfatase family protein [Neobacillus kokaensis]|uniref:Sulfatase n=1 Tax=Neobacillus kokaensis TaxID=2759023 RepID=A0ABQ3N216_9BACI|nr:sulfatase [Neobacillus kokaensis]GHH97905.1 sulfatase [Neobacillus kokaensis]